LIAGTTAGGVNTGKSNGNQLTNQKVKAKNAGNAANPYPANFTGSNTIFAVTMPKQQ